MEIVVEDTTLDNCGKSRAPWVFLEFVKRGFMEGIMTKDEYASTYVHIRTELMR